MNEGKERATREEYYGDDDLERYYYSYTFVFVSPPLSSVWCATFAMLLLLLSLLLLLLLLLPLLQAPSADDVRRHASIAYFKAFNSFATSVNFASNFSR